jgi:hypothetical protein
MVVDPARAPPLRVSARAGFGPPPRTARQDRVPRRADACFPPLYDMLAVVGTSRRDLCKPRVAALPAPHIVESGTPYGPGRTDVDHRDASSF